MIIIVLIFIVIFIFILYKNYNKCNFKEAFDGLAALGKVGSVLGGIGRRVAYKLPGVKMLSGCVIGAVSKNPKCQVTSQNIQCCTNPLLSVANAIDFWDDTIDTTDFVTCRDACIASKKIRALSVDTLNCCEWYCNGCSA